MGLILLLLFIGVPVLEIYLFIEVGGLIGTWPTIGIVILTAIVGSTMVRLQGLSVLAEAQRQADAGKPPVAQLAHGLMILIAGVLLLTPGFFTDAVGLALLIPPVRVWLGMAVWAYLQRRGTVHVYRGPEAGPGGKPGDEQGRGPGGRPARGRRKGPETIEGDYRDVTPDAREDAGGDSGRGPNESSPWRPKDGDGR